LPVIVPAIEDDAIQIPDDSSATDCGHRFIAFLLSLSLPS
jgi:hypothetical protein